VKSKVLASKGRSVFLAFSIAEKFRKSEAGKPQVLHNKREEARKPPLSSEVY